MPPGHSWGPCKLGERCCSLAEVGLGDLGLHLHPSGLHFGSVTWRTKLQTSQKWGQAPKQRTTMNVQLPTQKKCGIGKGFKICSESTCAEGQGAMALETSQQNGGDNKLTDGVKKIYTNSSSEEPGPWQALSQQQLNLTRGGSGWAQVSSR